MNIYTWIALGHLAFSLLLREMLGKKHLAALDIWLGDTVTVISVTVIFSNGYFFSNRYFSNQ